MNFLKRLLYILLFFLPGFFHAQTKHDSLPGKSQEDLLYTGTGLMTSEEHLGGKPKITISGYVSAYYAYYSDSVGHGNFQKFPTSAPRSNSLGLNLAQLSFHYSSHTARSTITLHYGDMPASVWSPVYNLIQEANAGLRLHKKIWLDAGFFRTHIGLESIQPRENITTNIAIVTYNEPYYLTGAKLSFLASDKLILQLNAFNSYNGFVETNRKKAVGFSATYQASDRTSFVFNTLWNDDTPDSVKTPHGRLYNNLFVVHKTRHFTLGAEANFAFQQNTSLDTALHHHTAIMWSALVSAKYKFNDHWATYAKAEYYYDKDEMLSGPVLDSRQHYVDLEIGGATLGMEWKPFQNAYLRLESRMLQTTDNEKIFKVNGAPSAMRYEVISELGVWF